jgi:hypothetical protein
MNGRLVWIAVVSLAVSAECALLVVLTSATHWIGDHRSWAAAAATCASTPWARKAGASASEPRTVDLEWPGSDAVKVDIPARVEYQPGPKAQASASGEEDLVSHVRMRDGTLQWDTIIDCFPAGDLVVHLTGPAVTAWTLNGSGKLDLSDIKQDVLRITTRGSGAVKASGEAHEVSLDVAGSGRADLSGKQDVLRITTRGSGGVTASGEAHELSLDVAGSSRVDLGRLVSEQANAHIRGSAEVDLAPRQDADIFISGSAVVMLHGVVTRIQTHVSGSGQIKQVP